jgi:hypothetical protein
MAWKAAAWALLLVLSAACSAGAVEDVTFTPWLPQESWPSGSQFDLRLAQPVSLWGAGIPLAQVFESLRQQTGVRIGFWPPEDYNARVCVNLYLNPEQPPTLRQVMVQLSWALDCAFGIADANGEMVYYLLSTSVGQGVRERLWAEQLEKRTRDEDGTERTRASLPARLEELRNALDLSREQAIGRYQGRDDLLLLAVLDPTRRAMAEFLLALPSMPDPARHLSLSAENIGKLPAGCQAGLREALRQPVVKAILREGAEGYQPGDDPFEWFLAHGPHLSVELGVWAQGASLRISGSTRGPGTWIHVGLPSLRLVGEDLLSQEYLDFRRALGDRIEDADLPRLENEYGCWLSKVRAGRRMAQQLDGIRLSQETESLLSATPLPLDLRKPCALWQIQEEAAKRTGLHIVSDCFWQPPRELRKTLECLRPNETPALTALLALQLSTVSRDDRDIIRRGRDAYPDTVSWEWRDAGRFLVFRSTDRDVWRGAFLSAEAVNFLDEWADAALPKEEGEVTPASVSVIPDWRAFGRIAGDIDPAQQKWGGVLTYGDPRDYRNACRQSLLEQMMEVVWHWPYALRFLSSLSDKQWDQLQADGLRVGSDMPLSRMVEVWRCRKHEPPPFSLEPRSTAPSDEDPGGWMGFAEGDVVRLTATDASGPAEEAQLLLQVLRDGRPLWSAGEIKLPATITLQPRSTESLVALPGGGSQPPPPTAPSDSADPAGLRR